jgi:hypothetical protein
MASSLALNDTEIAAYRRNGYIFRRVLFDTAETGRLCAADRLAG